ncbi:hypothetical protein BDK51DRAFT_4913, partial [Blyttiomyces helicus]
ITCSQFNCLLKDISNHPVFFNDSGNNQAPVCLQLIVSRKQLEFHGNAAGVGAVALMWRISEGAVVKFTDQIVTANPSLEPLVVAWPDAVEQMEI